MPKATDKMTLEQLEKAKKYARKDGVDSPTIEEINAARECLKRNGVGAIDFVQHIENCIEVLKNPKEHRLIARVWAKKSIEKAIEIMKSPLFFKDGEERIIELEDA